MSSISGLGSAQGADFQARRIERSTRLFRWGPTSAAITTTSASALREWRGVRRQRPDRIAVRLGAFAACSAALLFVAQPASAASTCGTGRASAANVGKPTAALAWRAGIVAHTPLWRSVPKRIGKASRSIAPRNASWLLVLRAARDRGGRCWLKVRLPSRPNTAAAWLNADRVLLRRTRWRLVVSRAARTIAVFRGGGLRRRFRVVIGAPSTPTPHGLFSIHGVWRWNPSDFLGSYVLPLTAHSHVLQEFGGGNGRVGIHGRGGASLLDPLGAARSHGCIRLANDAIEWIVRTVGPQGLPGIPVRVR
jgi:L,D-transpeptidase-like protein